MINIEEIVELIKQKGLTGAHQEINSTQLSGSISMPTLAKIARAAGLSLLTNKEISKKSKKPTWRNLDDSN